MKPRNVFDVMYGSNACITRTRAVYGNIVGSTNHTAVHERLTSKYLAKLTLLTCLCSRYLMSPYVSEEQTEDSPELILFSPRHGPFHHALEVVSVFACMRTG